MGRVERQAVRLLALALVAALLAGCGGSSRSTNATGCVKVFFGLDATRGREDAVASKLRRDRRVRSTRFVSKAQAFAEFKRKYPNLAKAIPANPLGDSLSLGVDRPDTAAVKASIDTPRPLVEHVAEAARPCAA